MNEFVIRKGFIALDDSQITGSLRLSNGSYSGSGAELYDIPASGITGLNSGSNVTQSFSTPSTTWTFNHNLGNSNVIIQTYDTANNQIIPENIQLFNANSALITFPTLEAGYAIATLGGLTVNNTIVNGTVNVNSFATTGSNTFIGNQSINGTVQVTSGNIIGTLAGNADTATTASFAQTASYVENAQTASYVVLAESASFVQNAQSASYVLNAVSASFATTAQTASFANTLYQADGTITSARTVTLGNNPLTFVGLTRTNRFFANGNIGIGTLVDGGSNLNVSGSVLIDGTLTVPTMSAASQIAISTTTLSSGGGQVSITAPNLVTTQNLSAGLSLLNSTAATSGVPVQISPSVILRSNTFSTTAQYSDILLYNRGVNGATSTPQFVIATSANGGTINDIFTLNNLSITYTGNGSVNFNSANLQSVSFKSANSILVGTALTNTIAASAVLEARSTTGGFLPPRMTSAFRTAISSPAQGLEVYDTDLLSPQVYNGTNWQGVIIPNVNSNVLIGTTLDTGFRTSISGSGASGSLRIAPDLQATSSAQSAILVTGSIRQAQTASNQIYGMNIAPTMIFTTGSQTNTVLRVAPTFSGSAALTSSQQNIIADFGATSVGSQFIVNDITSGSIYMVNDVSGLPIIEALSDWTVNMYNFPTRVFQKTGNNIIMSSSLTVVTGSGIELQVTNTGVKIGNMLTDVHQVTGSLVINPSSSFVLPLTASISPATGSAYWSGSFLFIYDGTQYRSASFA